MNNIWCHVFIQRSTFVSVHPVTILVVKPSYPDSFALIAMAVLERSSAKKLELEIRHPHTDV